MIKHHSAGGVYVREQTLKAGLTVEKHSHTYDHLSFLAQGSAIVEVETEMQVYHAPAALRIEAGKKHRIQAITDITWLCIHAEAIADPDMIKE